MLPLPMVAVFGWISGRKPNIQKTAINQKNAHLCYIDQSNFTDNVGKMSQYKLFESGKILHQSVGDSLHVNQLS